MGLTPKVLLDLESWLLNLGIVTHRRADTWTLTHICVLLDLTSVDRLQNRMDYFPMQSQILLPLLTGNSEYEV